MKRLIAMGLAGLALIGTSLFTTPPAQAQSVGYVTGIPGRDPADDDEFGWGPAYRPETTFAQPGTPLTPGQRAAIDYYQRTGRTVYPPVVTGSVEPTYAAPRRTVRSRKIVRTPAYEQRRIVRQRSGKKRVVAR